MYAIVKTGGKQYKAVEGDVLEVEKLAGEPGDAVKLPAVLLVDDGKVTSDAPTASVALAVARERPSARDGASTASESQAEAKPPSICAKITPELPRAPSSAPLAAIRAATDRLASGPASSRPLHAARIVAAMLVPVSPSGTGNTFSSSTVRRFTVKAPKTALYHRRKAAASNDISSCRPL